MLPWVMEYNMMSCLQWFKEIGEFMGENMEGLSDREAAAKTVAAMRTLAEDLEVPLYLNEVGIPSRPSHPWSRAPRHKYVSGTTTRASSRAKTWRRSTTTWPSGRAPSR